MSGQGGPGEVRGASSSLAEVIECGILELSGQACGVMKPAPQWNLKGLGANTLSPMWHSRARSTFSMSTTSTILRVWVPSMVMIVLGLRVSSKSGQ